MSVLEIFIGGAVCGTKIVLQLVSFHKPELVLSHLARAREELEANESRVPVALTILWILSQSFKDPRVGIEGTYYVSSLSNMTEFRY